MALTPQGIHHSPASMSTKPAHLCIPFYIHHLQTLLLTQPRTHLHTSMPLHPTASVLFITTEMHYGSIIAQSQSPPSLSSLPQSSLHLALAALKTTPSRGWNQVFVACDTEATDICSLHRAGSSPPAPFNCLAVNDLDRRYRLCFKADSGVA